MLKPKDDSHEFKPILSEIQESPVSPLGRATFWTIFIFFVFAMLWMYFGKIDVVVTARGKVIPDGHIKILQPLETGVVKKLLVKEGDFVSKGQVLMEIDPSTTVPELESLQKNLEHLELESSRLEAESYDAIFAPQLPKDINFQSIKTQQDIYFTSTKSLNDQLASKQSQIKMVEEQEKSTKAELDNNKKLLALAQDKEKRLMNVIDLIAKKDLEDVQTDIANYTSKIEELTYKLQELDHQKTQYNQEMSFIKTDFKTQNLKSLSDNQKQQTQLSADIDKIVFRNQQQKIISPVDGHVNNVFVHTVGGVVTPAEKLVSIVPVDAPLIVEATVLNKDVGFIKENMLASLKIDTFTYQKYGLLNGVVKKISKDSIDDEKLGPVYDVYIKPVNKSLIVEGERVTITSGMTLTAEIKVGKRRIIEFFIYPLIKYLDESISVR